MICKICWGDNVGVRVLAGFWMLGGGLAVGYRTYKGYGVGFRFS